MIQLNKFVLLFGIASIFLVSPVHAETVFNATEGIDAIETNNYANSRLEYYYYIPKQIIQNRQGAYPLLVMVPGLSGKGEYFVGPQFKRFAEEEKFIILAPSFIWDQNNWEAKKSYQYPSAWSGDALLRIIDALKSKNNLKISTLYLYGFSAGAQFALRFCIWKPELCTACVAHAGGGTVSPDRFIPVRFFVSVGTYDSPDRLKKAQEFCKLAKVYGIGAVYKEYVTRHELPAEQIEDGLRFIKNR